ncbi:MAG: FAD-dependent oxidoreductase [Nanoarchaeota archaeon]
MKEYLLKVLDTKKLSSGVATIRFKPNKMMEFKPGQFINIYLEGTKKPAAAYSIASPPDKDYIEISVKPVGEFSNKLCNVKVNEVIKAKGPFGHFYLDENKDAVLIAGGIGICPFKSMVDYAIKKKLKNNITLLYSCRTPNEIIYYDNLKSIREKNIKAVFTVTRYEGKDWRGESGRINKEMIKKYVKDLNNSVFYICGLRNMAEDIKNILKKLNVSDGNIRVEAWG